MEENPCLGCGACCAFYRASFHWWETDPSRAEAVPAEWTLKLDGFRVMMRGTHLPLPQCRCACLMGIIGKKVHCAIYPRRASVCRDFTASWQDGRPNERCDTARAYYGLPALQPGIGRGPGHVPRAA